jgi:hypothetical protein
MKDSYNYVFHYANYVSGAVFTVIIMLHAQ